MTDTKMVIVMRKDLGMREGKMIAQGSHAAVNAILQEMNRTKDVFKHVDGDPDKTSDEWLMHVSHGQPLYKWLTGYYKKICVYVNSEEELLELERKAIYERINCYLVTDNGLTEFDGVKTKTCLALGPDFSEEIDKITKHLPLL